MKMLFLLAGLLVQGIAVSQTVEEQQVGLSYSYAELRFVDVDPGGGDGIRLNGSFDLDNNWIIVGGLTALAVLWAVFLGEGSGFYEAMARPTDEPHRKLLVLVPLCSTAVGGLAANLLFPGFAPVGYFVAGWGDALGEPVGTAIGRHRYRVPSLGGVLCWRSLEGSAAVLVGGSLAALVALLLAGFDPPAATRVALACGFVGAVVEAISTHGTDNLTTQLAGAGVAYWLLG